ncbi:hypothetical protein [Catenuloplanes niger]|uniref:Uncharacterized protein n=2 Tax=Catenuloplanes TaxID=33874 RepID=A0AAE3ZNW3_9ACTN|nr:hypothetical protein [Catenuloplanes niger]MDR7323403.1 hypothetical protein [Catenuloplanes niger]
MDEVETVVARATDTYSAALQEAGFLLNFDEDSSGFEIEYREDGDGGWDLVIEVGHHHFSPGGGLVRELVLIFNTGEECWHRIRTYADTEQDRGEARELDAGLQTPGDAVVAYIRADNLCTRTECLDV